ncbi:MAG: FAD-dependent oxidoreductase [bacterium]|nr:FAD-dependent oxidoreductase [bacterium]
MAILESGRRNIVILGAGFGGITALLKLYRSLSRRGLLGYYQPVIVNRTAHHLYTPALYEIAAIPRGEADAVRLKSSLCIPLDDILGRLPGARLIGDTASRVDPERHVITFESGSQLNFEYLIIALGAETNFFGIPGMAEQALPLKTFEDAVRLRNRIAGLAATGETLRIIIGGGGATGVELSAELVNFLCYLKKRAAGKTCQGEITLLEGAPEILPGFGAAIIHRAKRRLAALGVRVVPAARIQEVWPSEVSCNGRTLPYHILVWAGGVRPAAVLKNFGLPLDERGGILVNEFLEARPRIYAIGDNASLTNPLTGRPLPGNVPVAEAEARLAARNIVAELTKRDRRPFRPLAQYPFILAVGGKYAVTDLVIIKFSGFLGWALKQLVELRYLLFILPWPKAVPTWVRTIRYSLSND